MWLIIGIIIGYFTHKAFSCLDKHDDFTYTDWPRGAPITFDEWKKKNNI